MRCFQVCLASARKLAQTTLQLHQGDRPGGGSRGRIPTYSVRERGRTRNIAPTVALVPRPSTTHSASLLRTPTRSPIESYRPASHPLGEALAAPPDLSRPLGEASPDRRDPRGPASWGHSFQGRDPSSALSDRPSLKVPWALTPSTRGVGEGRDLGAPPSGRPCPRVPILGRPLGEWGRRRSRPWRHPLQQASQGGLVGFAPPRRGGSEEVATLEAPPPTGPLPGCRSWEGPLGEGGRRRSRPR